MPTRASRSKSGPGPTGHNSNFFPQDRSSLRASISEGHAVGNAQQLADEASLRRKQADEEAEEEALGIDPEESSTAPPPKKRCKTTLNHLVKNVRELTLLTLLLMAPIFVLFSRYLQYFEHSCPVSELLLSKHHKVLSRILILDGLFAVGGRDMAPLVFHRLHYSVHNDVLYALGDEREGHPL